MSLLCNWNGKIIEEGKINISPNNRSFRYGDGCFETMKVIGSEILLAQLHFDRLFSSLLTLKFRVPSYFTPAYIYSQIQELVEANGHSNFARVRLVIFRGDGSLYDLEDLNPNFIIQSWKGSAESLAYNSNGLAVRIFTDAKKTFDLFSSIKSNNYLPYLMAAIAAKEGNLDDCILTNAHNRIADATIANVFILKDGIIKTPALDEGCVGGVMRQHLLGCLREEAIYCVEAEIEIDELLTATEVFLTNTNYGIRWVEKVNSSSYINNLSQQLYVEFIAPLFSSATF